MSQFLNPMRPRRGRALFALLGMWTAALLTACGGSTRIDPYVPNRVMAFGDELSLIKPDGSKYSINGLSTTNPATIDCLLLPNWTQSLATSFGLAYAACPITGSTTAANGVMAAALQARVADIESQVNSARAAEPAAFNPLTLATLQGGSWDVIDVYTAHKADTDPNAVTAVALVRTAASRLAKVVNQLADQGGGPRVVYATIPDLGLSPFAFAQQTAGACGISCNTLLTKLSTAFNETLRLGIVNDGHWIGQVTFDDTLRSMANPTFRSATYGLINTDAATQTAACTVTDVSTCTTDTLVTELVGVSGNASKYLWASDRLPGPAWHLQVGARAIARARNNPF